jgi:DnaK suppressor protein
MPVCELDTIQLKQLINLLTEQKQQLNQQLASSEASSQPVALDQQSVGRVSRIDAIQQQQMAKANRQQDTLTLKATIAALKRVENDEYGYCLECGESVGFSRLRIQPHAEMCLECQSAIENS